MHNSLAVCITCSTIGIKHTDRSSDLVEDFYLENKCVEADIIGP